MEIERKYLIDKEHFNKIKNDHQSYLLKQTYIALTDEREVRLRSKDEQDYFLTVKTTGGRSRQEYEIQLSPDQAEELRPLMQSQSIEKRRYLIPHGQLSIEADEYHGDLKGLLTAEVEFETEEAADAFEAPPWFLKEITDDKRYKNRNLVGKRYGDLEAGE